MLVTIKKIVIPILCLLHMTAIFWWTMPQSFAGIISEDINQTTAEAKLFNWLSFAKNSWLTNLLIHYETFARTQ